MKNNTAKFARIAHDGQFSTLKFVDFDNKISDFSSI